MDKYTLIFIFKIFFISLLFGFKCYSQTNELKISCEKRWQTPEVLMTSESVCYDPLTNLLYVSCINGNPAEKDGNGFIAELSLNGEVINLNWITGLNAPKGMSVNKSKLFVTDIDRVVEIDISKSAVSREFKVDGAKFLNDIVIDPNGLIYISDMATSKIHRINNGIVESWLSDEEIEAPNGMFYENKEILIGTKKGIYAVRINDKRIWPILPVDGGIDGLKADGHGNYIISDWKGKIQMVNISKESMILIDTSISGVNAADLEFIPGKNMLFVPTFSDNRVTAYEIIFK
jgi:sugar lactone lactonase YvrE